MAPANTDDGTVAAVIGSDSGKERHLHGGQGYIGRAGLRPNQKVKVTLQCPGSKKGDPVLVSLLDGGDIVPANEVLKVAPDGTVSFKYNAPATHGLFRVLVQVGEREQRLEFYVLDVDHPGNNPLRVRVVD